MDNDTRERSTPCSDRLGMLSLVNRATLNQTVLPDSHHWAQTLFLSSSKRVHSR